MSQRRNIIEPTLTEKIAEWVGKRYALILISSSLAVVISAIVLIVAEKSKEKQLEAWQKIAVNMSDKVLVATVDGRVALVEKKPLQPEIAKAVINSFVQDYFLFDIEHLFGGINNPRPPNFKAFIKNSPLVQKWLKAKVLTKSATPQVKSLLEYYWGLLNSDRFLSVPYTMYFKKVQNEDFKLDKKTNTWTYKASWIVEITYIKPDNSLGIGTGQTNVKLVGRFEPFNGNELNPLGIKLISISFKPVLVSVK